MPPQFEPVRVEPFSTCLASRCSELLDRPGMYDAAELEEVVRRIYEREDLWRPLVLADPVRRRYELLYEDERIDIWVLSWMAGQGTGFHDHDISDVGVLCAQGALDEGLLAIGEVVAPIRLTAGMSRNGPGGYIHSVTHVSGEPAVSLHAYSPPLMVVGQYRVDDAGRMRRDPEHGRKELYDRSIAVRSAQVNPSHP